MKKLYFYLFIIIVCIVLLFLAIKKSSHNSSLRIDKRHFAIEDTISINQIILQNRNLEKIKLNRIQENNKWVLNDSIKANQYLINLLLKTIKEMRIKSPIARAALPNIIQRMAIQHTRVEIWTHKKEKHVIYVGGETPDQLGTFMMIEGAVEPYIMHIPGFNGYLSSRFSCKTHLWKSKEIFLNNIQSAKYIIQSPKTNNTFNISDNNLKYLTSIYCESYLTGHDQFDINEIKNRTPFFTIQTETTDKKTQTLYCIRKYPVNKAKYQGHQYDRERFYGMINNTLMLIQYQQFNNFIEHESLFNQFTPWENK